MSENKNKTFEDILQEIAIKYHCNCWDMLCLNISLNITDVPYSISIAFKEAADLWGQYCREEGKKEGYAQGYFCEKEDMYNQGWNDALNWALQNGKIDEGQSGEFGEYIEPFIIPQSILSGLKQIDSNKEG